MNTHQKKSLKQRSNPSRRRLSARSVSEACTPNSEGPETIPRQWVWHHRTLLRLRDRLVRTLPRQVTPASSPPDMLDLDAADADTNTMNFDTMWTELGPEADRLFEIDCALQRIRDGVYGFVNGRDARFHRKGSEPFRGLVIPRVPQK
jgi:hypothetical protein